MSPLRAHDIELYIAKIQKSRILVLGDLMLDEFIWGDVHRISPEAPVPVVRVSSESSFPGGGANVARNIAEFGGNAFVGGMIGDDKDGEILMHSLRESSIGTDAVLKAQDHKTIVKTRVIAKHQQIVRVDREHKRKIDLSEIDMLMAGIEKMIHQIDAIIIEDYGKGFITQPLVDSIINLSANYMKIVAVDPNPNNPLDWAGATIVKPNRKEAFASVGVPFDETEHDIVDLGEVLLEKWRIHSLLITLGEEGMMLFDPPDAPYHIPTRAREVFDVSGAGDTVIAFYTMAIAAGLRGVQAAELANHAAGVVVGKLGTATVSPQELLKSFVDE